MVAEVYPMGGKDVTKGYEPSLAEYSPNKHGRQYLMRADQWREPDSS